MQILLQHDPPRCRKRCGEGEPTQRNVQDPGQKGEGERARERERRKVLRVHRKGKKNPSVERARRGVLRDLELWEQMKNEGIYLTRGKRGGKIGLDGRRVDGGKKGKRYG